MFEKAKKSITKIVATLMLTGCVMATPVMTQVSLAADPNMNSVVGSINNSKTTVMGDATKNKVTGLSKEVLDVVLVVVMTALLISGTATAMKFKGAGDNSSAKAQLKTKLLYECLAIVFLASYFGFVKFGFTNLNFFK